MKLLLCLVCVLLGIGCEAKDVEVVAVNVNQDSLRPMYHLDGFDCQEILLELIHSNGDIETVPLETTMIALDDQTKLLEAGAHVLNIEAFGHDTVLPVNLYQTDYDYELINLYIQGIHQSVIKDLSYEEWLLSIEGAPGIHMVDAMVDDKGHLILTMSDESTHNLGIIEGSDGINGTNGLDALNIELDVINNTIMWRYEDLEWNPLVSLSSLRGYRGFTGAKGTDGLGISASAINDEGTLVITYTDGTSDRLDLLGNAYSVIYQDIKGSILDIKTVVKGSAITPPDAPYLEGHTFLRWSETIESISDHHVIKPVYEKNTVTVSFDTQGGNPIDSVSTLYGEKVDLPTPEKEGYLFKGWALGDSLNDQHFTDQEPVYQDQTLVALWEKPLLTVVFMDETGEPLKTAYTYPGGDITPPDGITKVGHTFTGWSHTSAGVSQDLLIEPVFEVNTYTLTLHETTEIPHGGPFEEGETLVKAVAGAFHAGLLTSEGRVILWGDNTHAQLGTGSALSSHAGLDITGRFALTEEEMITDIALGHSHGLALTNFNRIFAWGYNFYGQLGNGNFWTQDSPVDISIHFPDDLVIEEIFASMHHSAFITDTNEIYTWGDNTYGQLAHESVLKVRVPTKVETLSLEVDETMIDFAVGGTHLGVLTDQNRTYMWGSNSTYQLSSPSTGNYGSPIKWSHGYMLNPGESLTNLELGHNHSALVSSDNRIFMYGNNASGQLGLNSTSHKYVPTEVSYPIDSEVDELDSLVLGNETSFMTTKLGRIFAFGANNTHQLTGSDTQDQLTPKEITSSLNLDEEDIILALGQTVSDGFSILMAGHSTYAWGDNSNHQLSMDSVGDSSIPIELSQSLEELETHDVFYGSSLNEYLGSTITWYTDDAFTNFFDENNMPGEDLILYGQSE